MFATISIQHFVLDSLSTIGNEHLFPDLKSGRKFSQMLHAHVHAHA